MSENKYHHSSIVKLKTIAVILGAEKNFYQCTLCNEKGTHEQLAMEPCKDD